jgi:3-phenylpropionate/trans-cinnamate dioxygenase ferredoxin subunit
VTYVRACALADVPVGTVAAFDLGGDVDIAVVNTDDGVFAIQDLCSHAEYPLSEGDVDGCTLECVGHGSRFDLRTGFPLELPATAPVPVYPVRVDGDAIFIDPDNPKKVQEHNNE